MPGVCEEEEGDTPHTRDGRNNDFGGETRLNGGHDCATGMDGRDSLRAVGSERPGGGWGRHVRTQDCEPVTGR